MTGRVHRKRNVGEAVENGDLQWIYPLKMVIFHSYVSLPEGIWNLLRLRMKLRVFIVFYRGQMGIEHDLRCFNQPKFGMKRESWDDLGIFFYCNSGWCIQDGDLFFSGDW